jgi:hypothetical protein
MSGLWKSVQSSIAQTNDDPIGSINSGLDSVLGPSYDYLQTIQSPSQKGVSSDGNIGQVFTNANAIRGYVDNLIVGPKVGNQFFRETGGTCMTPNKKEVSRYTYINNKLGGDDAAGIFGASFQRAVQGSGFDGIIPGAGGDIASMNPLKIINGLVLDGIPECKPYRCPVTNVQTGVDAGEETRFLTPSLELNMRGCREVTDAAQIIELENTEQNKSKNAAKEVFSPYFENTPRVLINTDPTPVIFWGVAVILLGILINCRRCI